MTDPKSSFHPTNFHKWTPKSNILWWALIAAGVLLRLYPYFLQRSFWADEASLALNLVERNFAQLILPLNYQQGAPIGFLFIEKLSIILLGNNEYALRLFPLAAGILALFLMVSIAREHFGMSGLFAVTVFAFGWNLIYYSSELKQYSSDAALLLLLVALALRLLKPETASARDFILLGAVGSLVIWVSHPSFFSLAAIGVALLIEKLFRKNYAPLSWILALGVAWLASFGLQYLVSLRHLASDGFLQSYWGKAFMPMPPWSNKTWFFNTYLSMMDLSISTEMIAIYLVPVLLVIGGVSLLVRKRGFALILILIPVMALAASALQKYPLKGRFMLFLIPPLLLILSEGLGRIYEFLSARNRPLAFALSALPALWLAFFPALVTFYETRALQPNAGLRPMIEHIAQHRAADDVIYSYQSAEPPFRYYAPLFGIQTEGDNVVIAPSTPSKKQALERFFKDLDKLQGRGRVWFVFTDIVDCGGCDGDPQAFYVAELEERGILLDQSNGIGANAYLYELP